MKGHPLILDRVVTVFDDLPYVGLVEHVWTATLEEIVLYVGMSPIANVARLAHLGAVLVLVDYLSKS